MAATPTFLLHVYVTTDVAIKVTLTERPEWVKEPINILREKAKPRLEFTLHYEDLDFGGQLGCLVDIQELPEKVTLKMIRSESDTSSCASSDTDILPLVPISQHQKSWPDIFPVLTFSYEVEHVLKERNSAFATSAKTLKLTRSQKHNILENMAALMYNFKHYPSDNDVGMAAEALVTAHPCLKEPGSGESQASLEEMRLQIMDEVQKSLQNLRLIEMLMQKTFALRRQEIIQENPQVKDFLGKWPALRIESQVEEMSQASLTLLVLLSQQSQRTLRIKLISVLQDSKHTLSDAEEEPPDPHPPPQPSPPHLAIEEILHIRSVTLHMFVVYVTGPAPRVSSSGFPLPGFHHLITRTPCSLTLRISALPTTSTSSVKNVRRVWIQPAGQDSSPLNVRSWKTQEIEFGLFSDSYRECRDYFEMRRTEHGIEEWVDIKWMPNTIYHSLQAEIAKQVVEDFPNLPISIKIPSSDSMMRHHMETYGKRHFVGIRSNVKYARDGIMWGAST
ncbi:hypothetical protein E1301_Tti022172 [Triplophysa tibetana]|uniref:Uncharacterized protein n=1 Tax=Triplophysa tibetana TaxID=1572043 RepID=A0A5A9NAW6_9TELE|nr:hypothetical protein E1301_Tti022172 [Triplophysa tibetana]